MVKSCAECNHYGDAYKSTGSYGWYSPEPHPCYGCLDYENFSITTKKKCDDCGEPVGAVAGQECNEFFCRRWICDTCANDAGECKECVENR